MRVSTLLCTGWGAAAASDVYKVQALAGVVWSSTGGGYAIDLSTADSRGGRACQHTGAPRRPAPALAPSNACTDALSHSGTAFYTSGEGNCSVLAPVAGLKAVSVLRSTSVVGRTLFYQDDNLREHIDTFSL